MHLTEWLKTDDTSIIQNWFINFIQHSVNHTVPIVEIDLSAFFLQLEVRTFTITFYYFTITLLVSQKIESWCSRQIPVQEVPMRSTDAIYDFR